MNIIIRTTGLALVVVLSVFSINITWANESQNTTSRSEHSHEHQPEKIVNEVAQTHEHFKNEQTEGKAHESEKTIKDKHEQGITLNAQKVNLAGIKVEPLLLQKYINTVYAPGEVKANGYKSYIVSPRTDSVVINRHAILGDHVAVGQELVTLFSETMAQAQADFLIASSDWHRARKLDNNSISERTLVEAENIYKAAYGKLVAFGLTIQAIKKISQQEISTFGQYALIAKREGVVLQDDFMQGQRIEAGETIMLIADESELWIEANISPNKALDLRLGRPALIDLNGTKYQGKVIQEAHTIDPTTRTRIVRLSVNNAGHTLHSGMFVKVNFQFESKDELIAVPEEALIRNSDGDWTVFIEDQPNEFNPVEVTRGRAFGEYREILGVASGANVVTRGAFFVASEMAKGGFDPHNH